MRARLLFVFTALGMLLLSGCVNQPEAALPTPTPSATPIFSSDEEALAAAIAAYERYLEVSDQIAADGGANPERLKDLVTPEWYEKEVEGFAAIAAAGMYQRGSTVLEQVELQSSNFVEKSGELVIYACTDFSNTAFVDAAGTDVTPMPRTLRLMFEITLAVDNETIQVAGSEPWSELSC